MWKASKAVTGRWQLLVSRYYDQLTGLTSDPACKDESRLCYFTYSPDGYVASLYQSFVLEAAVETQPFQPTAENLPLLRYRQNKRNLRELLGRGSQLVPFVLHFLKSIDCRATPICLNSPAKLAGEGIRKKAYYAGLRFILSTPTFLLRKSGASYNLVTKSYLYSIRLHLSFALLFIRTK